MAKENAVAGKAGAKGALIQPVRPERSGRRIVIAGTGQRTDRSDVPFAVRLLMSSAPRIASGRLDLILPSGQVVRFQGKEDGYQSEIIVHSMRFARRAVFSGYNGLADAYVAGEIDSPDLTAALGFFAANTTSVRSQGLFPGLARLENMMRLLFQANSRKGARANIRAHYDLGNAFFTHWLDETMTYSSACFRSADESLGDAQLTKYRKVIEKLNIQPGQRLLEIGCGWGGFSEIVARLTGAHVTALTISEEQYAYARARMADAGLSDRVDVCLKDYRDVREEFDHIVSIEMFEAVGKKYWPTFFAMLKRSLKSGGRVVLQTITIADELFADYARHTDFVRRYVFPGGHLASPQILAKQIASAGLRIDMRDLFGQSYARTLKCWSERFEEAWARGVPGGFDARFARIWRFYLASCEIGFRVGFTDVGQYVLASEDAE